MTKKIKLNCSVFSVGLLSITSILTTVSCSNQKYSNNDIGGLNQWFNPGQNENKKLINYVDQINHSNNEKAKNLLKQKTILLTSGGSIGDFSFNQSAWEAISKFSKEIGNKDNEVFQVISISEAEQFNAYDYAIAKGFKIWVLTGFQQEWLLRNWLKTGRNLERFKNNKINVIALDWFPGDDPEDVLSQIKGSVLGINFRSQEAAFTASYAAAELMEQINKSNPDSFKADDNLFNSFGGFDIGGITNFNYGFYEGLRQHNEDNISQNRDYLLRATSPINLNTTFTLNNGSKVAVQNQVNGVNDQKKPPKVIFPVAGELIANVIDLIKQKKSDQWVIGVDTNQALVFATDKAKILTSVEKKIAIAIYKALLTLYQLDGYENNNKSFSLLPNGYHFNDDNLIVNEKNNLTNFNAIKGYKDGFVDVAKSTLDQNLRFQNGSTYAQKYDEIVANTWDEFFGNENKKLKGRFNINKSESENNKKGLKPTEDEIKMFEQAIADSNNLSKENIEAILNLKNVLFGSLTQNNQKNYFEPTLDLINNMKI